MMVPHSTTLKCTLTAQLDDVNCRHPRDRQKYSQLEFLPCCAINARDAPCVCDKVINLALLGIIT